MWFFGGSKNQDDLTTTAQQEQITSTPQPVSSIPEMPAIPTFDASRLHPLAGLDKEIEYLDLEDEKLNQLEGASNGFIASRGWTDDLCYGTGTIYVLGLGLGGLIGFNDGLKNLPAPRVDPTTGEVRSAPFKLKLNTVLNQVTKHGPHVGNSAGVLALLYNLIDSSLDAYRGKHDDLNSLLSGALAGAVFKSSSGLKAVGYSSALMSLAAAAWCGLKRSVN